MKILTCVSDDVFVADVKELIKIESDCQHTVNVLKGYFEKM